MLITGIRASWPGGGERQLGPVCRVQAPRPSGLTSPTGPGPTGCLSTSVQQAGRSYLRLWHPWLSAGRSQASSLAHARPMGRLASSQRSLECLKENGEGQVQTPAGSACSEDAAPATAKAGLCTSGKTVGRAELSVLCYLSTLPAPGLFALQE